ncbi:MAG: aldo/keto reductase [Flavobacterium sp.]|nr:aldo/keto reductase [Flavobacterium sp.]
MKYTILPNTELKISKLCLGTMTFGEQNSENESHKQLDYAFENGINFIDTAEMYPIAAKESTLGLTEKYIGSWLRNKNRADLVIASKIAGPNRGMGYIRAKLDFSKKSITEAVENSLKNLRTDYIDLYQLHWPERKMNFFGQRGFSIVEDVWEDNFNDILTTLNELIKEGKIKNIGISNETPFGLSRFLEESKYNNLPRIATIQNPYSLLNRLFEVGLSEMCYRESVGLLSYSPLGFGVLTGKHQSGIVGNSRNGLFPQFTRYTNDNCIKATNLYINLANEYGLSITELALAFVQNQQIVTSTIIGATTLEQLKENINTKDITLSEDIIAKINLIHSQIPDPAP